MQATSNVCPHRPDSGGHLPGSFCAHAAPSHCPVPIRGFTHAEHVCMPCTSALTCQTLSPIQATRPACSQHACKASPAAAIHGVRRQSGIPGLRRQLRSLM